MTYGLRMNHILSARPAPRDSWPFLTKHSGCLRVVSTVKAVNASNICGEWSMGGLGDRHFVPTGSFESLGYYV
jgi:hypothetical protein